MMLLMLLKIKIPELIFDIEIKKSGELEKYFIIEKF